MLEPSGSVGQSLETDQGLVRSLPDESLRSRQLLGSWRSSLSLLPPGFPCCRDRRRSQCLPSYPRLRPPGTEARTLGLPAWPTLRQTQKSSCSLAPNLIVQTLWRPSHLQHVNTQNTFICG